MLGRHVDAVASFQKAAQPVLNIDFGGEGVKRALPSLAIRQTARTVRAGRTFAYLIGP